MTFTRTHKVVRQNSHAMFAEAINPSITWHPRTPWLSQRSTATKPSLGGVLAFLIPCQIREVTLGTRVPSFPTVLFQDSEGIWERRDLQTPPQGTGVLGDEMGVTCALAVVSSKGTPGIGTNWEVWASPYPPCRWMCQMGHGCVCGGECGGVTVPAR